MTITVSGRHMEVTPPLKAHAEEKAAKLDKYYDLIQEIEVIFDVSKGDVSTVEMIVRADHKNTFVAHETGPDAYASIDACMHKLERQLSEHKKIFRNRKHSGEKTGG